MEPVIPVEPHALGSVVPKLKSATEPKLKSDVPKQYISSMLKLEDCDRAAVDRPRDRMSHDDSSFNFTRLEKDLDKAVDADAKYWRENDAKMRAVTQRVATYDEFREIVLASHLKPLEKGDQMHSVKFNQPWNSVTMTTKENKDNSLSSDKHNQVNKSLPKNSQEFAREWRRHYKVPNDRYAFLISLGADKLGDILRSEINMGLLGEMLVALTQLKDSEEEGLVVLDILDKLTSVNRFSLSLQFLSSKEKDTCRHLFEILRTCLSFDCELLERIRNLNTVYCSV